MLIHFKLLFCTGFKLKGLITLNQKMQIMKKLLFIFSMALICAITTSSFKPVQSAAAEFNQTITEAPTDVVKSSDKKKEDKKKQKKAAVPVAARQKPRNQNARKRNRKAVLLQRLNARKKRKLKRNN
jgi:uncharacterized membrane protein